jgi:hypothetical protein
VFVIFRPRSVLLTPWHICRNGQMVDLIRRRGTYCHHFYCCKHTNNNGYSNYSGFAVENINVGHDAATLTRIASAVGRSGAKEDDWPVVATPAGVMYGTVAELESALASSPPLPQPALEQEQMERIREREAVLAQRRAAEERLKHLRQQERKDDDATRDLEDSIHVLDMRLSVIGDQFRRAPVSGTGGSVVDLENVEDDDDNALSDSFLLQSNATNEVVADETVGSPLGTVDLALEGLEWAMVKGLGWVQGMVVSPSEMSPATSSVDGNCLFFAHSAHF